jgi:hypothetical protein
MHRANRLEELDIANRLHKMYVEAGFRRPLAIAMLSPSCESHQHSVLAPRFLPQASRGLVAVHFWHPEIQENDLRLELVAHGECLDAVVGHAHVVSGKVEKESERLDGIGIVVGDQYAAPIDRDSR